MKVAYLSSAYLAPVEYYSKLLNYDKIFIEQHDHYMKQTGTVVPLPDRKANWHFLSPP
mgnify:CR=1 FL=1